MGKAQSGGSSGDGMPASAPSGSAGGASIASLALTTASDITAGSGVQAQDDFQADRAERAAQFGAVQATLTDSTMRQNLNTTLGNIEAVRGAAGVDPTSPTTAALMDRSESLSDSQRMAAVGSIKSQDEEDLASAAYLRQAGDFAVTQSYLKAGTDAAAALAKAG